MISPMMLTGAPVSANIFTGLSLTLTINTGFGVCVESIE